MLSELSPTPSANADTTALRIDASKDSMKSGSPAEKGTDGNKANNGDEEVVLPEGTLAQVEGELLLLAVGNGRQAGCGVNLCPHAGDCTRSANLR